MKEPTSNSKPQINYNDSIQTFFNYIKQHNKKHPRKKEQVRLATINTYRLLLNTCQHRVEEGKITPRKGYPLHLSTSEFVLADYLMVSWKTALNHLEKLKSAGILLEGTRRLCKGKVVVYFNPDLVIFRPSNQRNTSS